VDVRYHPLFERWLNELAEADEEIFGEVMALLTALELHGRDLEDERRDESHPVVTSRFDMHALRRTRRHRAPRTPVRPRSCGSSTHTAPTRLAMTSPSSSSAATRPASATSGIRRRSPKLSNASTSTAGPIRTSSRSPRERHDKAKHHPR
jgi:hypothetical protein